MLIGVRRALIKPATSAKAPFAFFPGSAVAGQAGGFATATLTFPSTNGGVNYPAGSLIMAAWANADGNVDPTIFMGGVAMTKTASSVDKRNQLWQLVAASAVGDTLTITNGVNWNLCAITTGYFTGANSSNVGTYVQDYSGSGAQPVPVTLTIAAGQIGLAQISSAQLTGTPTWRHTTSALGDVTSNSANYSSYLAHSTEAGTPAIDLAVSASISFANGVAAAVFKSA